MLLKPETKTARLLQIETLLLAHPSGMTQAELARTLGVNRSTIHRYLPDLPAHIYIDDEDGFRWKIDRHAYLVNVHFTLNEAMAIHLAVRLLATRMDRQNPHAAAAVHKLGMALERLAPQISQHLQYSADEIDAPSQRHDPVYLAALERLTLAWAVQKKVDLWHRHTDGQVEKYRFAPYFIEPYAIGQSTYVIGWREPPDALRTFKIERIERVEPTQVEYRIPPDFDAHDLLADAWGIWYTDAEPVEVTLRFSPAVAGRVRESTWHRSQTLQEMADGSLVWSARIAEPTEMLNWIRGWGAEVEVLGPPTLRAALAEDARRTAELYDN